MIVSWSRTLNLISTINICCGCFAWIWRTFYIGRNCWCFKVTSECLCCVSRAEAQRLGIMKQSWKSIPSSIAPIKILLEFFIMQVLLIFEPAMCESATFPSTICRSAVCSAGNLRSGAELFNTTGPYLPSFKSLDLVCLCHFVVDGVGLFGLRSWVMYGFKPALHFCVTPFIILQSSRPLVGVRCWGFRTGRALMFSPTPIDWQLLK